MKGVILAGGYGTRLRPLTHVVNKHLLPVYDKPMVLYALGILKESGIRDVLIVSEESHCEQFSRFLKDGSEYGVSLSYEGQRGAGGIAEALGLAKEFVGADSLAVILGDNIFENHFASDVASFVSGAKVFLKEVSDPERFGVPVLQDGKIALVEEKPSLPKTRYAVTGFYLFDSSVFDVVGKLRPSNRGELEITDAVNAYAKEGSLTHGIVEGYWSDAGTFQSLLEASVWAAGRDVSGTASA